jgi:putative DNA primase/helicase
MTAKEIARALGGQKVGAVWMTPCPAHDDRNASLLIADARRGKVLVRCQAGCDQRKVIAALQARGAWKSTGQGAGGSFPRAGKESPAKPDRDSMNRVETSLAVRGDSHAPEDRKTGNLMPSSSHETAARDLVGFRHLLETEYMRLPADIDSALEQVERMTYWLEQMKLEEVIKSGGEAK